MLKGAYNKVLDFEQHLHDRTILSLYALSKQTLIVSNSEDLLVHDSINFNHVFIAKIDSSEIARVST